MTNVSLGTESPKSPSDVVNDQNAPRGNACKVRHFDCKNSVILDTLILVMLKFSSRGQRLKMPLWPDTKMYTKKDIFVEFCEFFKFLSMF